MCLVSVKVARALLITICVISFLNAVGVLAMAISALFNPLLAYAYASLTVTFFALIIFALLFAGAVLSCIGLACRKSSLFKFHFITHLIAVLGLLALSAAMVTLNSLYSPKSSLATCAERYEVVKDLVYLGSTTVQDQLCSTACVCDYNLDETIKTALGAGVDLQTGVKRL